MPLRSRLRVARSGLTDRRGRAAHAVRHAVRGRRDGRIGVFNLDLHVSVIADARLALSRYGIEVENWSLSGHTWVFGRDRDPVAVVNERTAFRFGPPMIRRFRQVYGRYLRSFEGFVAAYPPCFALLYEGLERPTLALAATRYEWPFTFDRTRWDWLDARLRQAVEDGWLHLAANNRADAGYIENYLGLTPTYVPSSCGYVGPAYTGRRRAVVVSAKSEDVARAICDQLRSEAVPLRTALGYRYSWSDLYDHRAIVLIPYNVSLMALFEHYSACAPIYVPNRPFLKRLMAEYPRAVLSQLSYAQESLELAAAPRETAARDLNELRDEAVVDWYLDRADFYDAEWMPQVRQFESWSHLDHLLARDDHAAIGEEMAVERPARLERIAKLWDELDWLARVRSAAGVAPTR
jgi:hypothetical protein